MKQCAMFWGMNRMANGALDITQYTFSATDELLLDTNVWMFVHGPVGPGRSAQVALYSGALARILDAGSHMYIDVLILSEFINSYARLMHNIVRFNPGIPRDFKRFRASAMFKPIAQDIALAVRRVLKNCEQVDSGFDMLDIDALVSEYEQGNSDFNDLVITDLCKRRGLTLITDDSDFKGSALTVLTANKNLLP